MTEICNKQAENVILDSAAFIKRANLEKFGNLYTVPEVVDELKDAKTREYVQFLPYNVIFQVPDKNTVSIVSQMAMKTGDYSALSKTDIKLIALTYDLHKSLHGEPVHKEVKPMPNNLRQQAFQFFEKDIQPNLTQSDTLEISDRKIDENDGSSSSDSEKYDWITKKPVSASLNENTFQKEILQSEQIQSVNLDVLSDENNECSSDSEECDWITEDNFHEKAANNFGFDSTYLCNEETDGPIPTVACLTTDFAMQNVLLHLGLEILSFNGLRIRQPRTHLLWCRACFRPTKRTDTYFCPYCGHPDLGRVAVTLHEDGDLQFHFSRKYVYNRRSAQIPTLRLRGGKYADDPIYCADQRIPDRRPASRKNPNVMPIASNGLLELTDAFEFLQCSELASNTLFPLNDISSRAAVRGIRSDHQIPRKHYQKPNCVEHGLKPTKGSAYLTKHRTGNKKSKKV